MSPHTSKSGSLFMSSGICRAAYPFMHELKMEVALSRDECRQIPVYSPLFAAIATRREKSYTMRYTLRAQPHVLHITPQIFRRWVPSLGLWGVGAGAAVAYLMSDVPLFRTDVLNKLPIVKSYFIDDTPASDKPF
ncbi:hypothetical protein BS47DRAFT_1357651 [Hydnum rufescens UP504]|uniref:Uncharacterized protein n=1 Tax=Hydnum rufescens UP504 TaxID=1448309 RepID=A0A9P6E1V3_9AGAM|nr:hypothetical protein BS47DRAFT_1357651 [Hydnum rufescens UP504]